MFALYLPYAVILFFSGKDIYSIFALGRDRESPPLLLLQRFPAFSPLKGSFCKFLLQMGGGLRIKYAVNL